MQSDGKEHSRLLRPWRAWNCWRVRNQASASDASRYPDPSRLLAENHTEKETWLMALNDAKYGRLADLQTIQQTATIRQAKRKSLHAVSRRSSSSAFSVAQDPNYMPIDDLVLAVEADGYNSPVVQEAGRMNGACRQCRAAFTLIKAPHPCLLACGKLFCSDCLVQVCVSSC